MNPNLIEKKKVNVSTKLELIRSTDLGLCELNLFLKIYL